MPEPVAVDVIRSYFERWRRLEDEKAAISEDLKELFAEMKGNGVDTKVARKVFRDKTVDQNERAEVKAIHDLYWAALSGPRAGRAREGAPLTTINARKSGHVEGKVADMSYPAIARRCGRSDHTTARHGVAAHEKRLVQEARQ